MSSPFRAVLLLAGAIAVASIATPVGAQGIDVANGKRLYEEICSGCHPGGSGGFAITKGAGNPDAIQTATRTIGAMFFLRDLIFAPDFNDLAAYLLQKFGPNPGPRATVVEFYYAALDHYFISSLQPDIDALDSGKFAGWARTNFNFKAWATNASPPVGSSPVCRFYLPPANGDSHFYSASPAECAEVLAKFPTFSFESPEVMYVILPDTTTGACPPQSTPVYRVWNQRADSNHRYTTDLAVRAQMLARGYVGEGYGPTAVAMCSPN